jgi:hypothetical protein
MHSGQRSHQGLGSQQRTAVADGDIMAESAMPSLSASPQKTGTKRPKRYHTALSSVKFFNREIQGVMTPYRSFQGCGRKSLW